MALPHHLVKTGATALASAPRVVGQQLIMDLVELVANLIPGLQIAKHSSVFVYQVLHVFHVFAHGMESRQGVA